MSSVKDLQNNLSDLVALVSKHYDLKGDLKALDGEEDYNYLLTTKDGDCYTVKLSRKNIAQDNIEFQAAILNHLSTKDLPFSIPKIIKSNSSDDFVSLPDNQFLRLQTWVQGRMLANVNPRSNKVLKEWGSAVGTLSKNLIGFDHPAAHRFYKWNPSETLESRRYSKHFETKEQKDTADYFWELFEEKVLGVLPALRKSVNYNDAHEMNLLMDDDYLHPKLVGIIDFGDALYCETINELAIACAYAGMHQRDPLRAMSQIVAAYHQTFPLEEKELEVLFLMITARLLITVSSAAHNKFKEPDNEYLQVSAKPAWELLDKLQTIPIELAHYTFRHACGFEACPSQMKFQDWLGSNKNALQPIVDFDGKNFKQLDLSIGSMTLGNNNDFEDIQNFNKKIDDVLESGKYIGFGGYLEARPIYTAKEFVEEKNDGKEWRTIHLGIDIWSHAGTNISSPLDAEVHSFANNEGEGNYGPTIILKHQVEEDFCFYTLYGHLSLDSLDGLSVGKNIKAGIPFAKMGDHTINGNWPPHLHFQVILDMMNFKADYPGVAFPKEKMIYKSLCPDPRVFFNLPFGESQSVNKQKILEKRKHVLGSSLSLAYQEPLQIVRAYKQFLYDQNGRRYLDTCNNVPHVGHQHPVVVKAAQNQIAVLNTNTRYLHKNIVEYAEKLLSSFPKELSVVHFVNSGSEANELALRMARAYTNEKDVIAVEVGYHGNTNACIAISSYKFDGKGGTGKPEHTHLVPLPDTFRGRYKDPETAGEKYASHVKEVIDQLKEKGRGVSSFICEGIISCGGQIVLPKNYLKHAFEHVREAGGICIVDEVQVGFGRVGEKFWAFELQGVIPDIVTLGKPIGNGHPLAAVVCTRKVAESFANGMEFFNTFGGNPVSCAIGSAVLDVIMQEGLQSNAKEIGNYLLKEIRHLQKRFPIIGDVRGHGLFLGFELVRDLNILDPAAEQTAYFVNRMKDKGILMSVDGPLHNVIKIKPPLCFNKADAKFLIANMELVLQEDFMNLSKVQSK